MAEKPQEQNIVKMQSRAGKVENQPIGQCEMYSASFGILLSENRGTFPIKELRKNDENRVVL